MIIRACNDCGKTEREVELSNRSCLCPDCQMKRQRDWQMLMNLAREGKVPEFVEEMEWRWKMGLRMAGLKDVAGLKELEEKRDARAIIAHADNIVTGREELNLMIPPEPDREILDDSAWRTNFVRSFAAGAVTMFPPKKPRRANQPVRPWWYKYLPKETGG